MLVSWLPRFQRACPSTSLDKSVRYSVVGEDISINKKQMQ